MIVYDKDFNIVKNPSLDNGRIEAVPLCVDFAYVIDSEEVHHEEVIAEYPETGGVDVAIVVDSPQRGHWEAKISETGKRLDLDFSGWPDNGEGFRDIVMLDVYEPFTQNEKNEHDRLAEAAEEEQRREDERQKMLDSLPDNLASIDDAICELYETDLAQSDIMDEQDAAICALYEMMEA